MKNVIKIVGFAMLVGMSSGVTACAVARDQQSVGAYVDDATISNTIRLHYAQSPIVSMLAIDVETLNGVVQLSGFAHNSVEKIEADRLAREVRGVRYVRNDLIIK